MGLGLLDSLVSLEILSLRWVNLAVAVLVKKKQSRYNINTVQWSSVEPFTNSAGGYATC